MGGSGNSNITIQNQRTEGFRTLLLPTKDFSKNRSVGGANYYKCSLPGDHAGNNLNCFGSVSSNASNAKMLEQIYEKIADTDQKYDAMVTIHDRKKRTSTLCSSEA
jgi:hypothetical protein